MIPLDSNSKTNQELIRSGQSFSALEDTTLFSNDYYESGNLVAIQRQLLSILPNVKDVSVQRQLNDIFRQLGRVAEKNPISGYQNRNGLKRFFDRHIKPDPDMEWCLVYFDINYLRRINSIIEQYYADRLLAAIAHTIQKILTTDDTMNDRTLFHIEGGAYAVLCRDISDLQGCNVAVRIIMQLKGAWQNSIIESARLPPHIDDLVRKSMPRIQMAAGVCGCDKGDNVYDWLNKAEEACANAKQVPSGDAVDMYQSRGLFERGSTELFRWMASRDEQVGWIDRIVPELRRCNDLNRQDTNGYTMLMHCIDMLYDGDERPRTAAILLATHPKLNPNTRNKDGLTSLMLALKREQNEIAQTLVYHHLYQRSDFDMQLTDTAMHFDTAFADAVANDRVKEIVTDNIQSLQLDSPPDNNDDDDDDDIATTDAWVDDALLSADDTHNDEKKTDSDDDDDDDDDLSIYDGGGLTFVGKTVLDYALTYYNQKVALILLQNGAEKARYNHIKPYFDACQSGRLEAVQMYIEEFGIHPNIFLPIAKMRTGLHNAASTGCTHICRYLLSKGAYVDPNDQIASTPLHIACLGGQLSTVKVLIVAGAAIDECNFRGFTPLLYACNRHKHDDAYEIIKLLLEKGADPTKTVKELGSKNALQIVENNGKLSNNKQLQTVIANRMEAINVKTEKLKQFKLLRDPDLIEAERLEAAELEEKNNPPLPAVDLSAEEKESPPLTDNIFEGALFAKMQM